MQVQSNILAGLLNEVSNPRAVTRGIEFQVVFLGLDSLYLVVEYPHSDVFDLWSSFVPQAKDARLYDGIPVWDFLLRRGGLGYTLSVWQGDARLFLTDRVDDKLANTGAAGQGMGLMLQLGPKWLRQHDDLDSTQLIEGVYQQLRKFRVRQPEKYPIRLNRIDIAMDVRGLHTAAFSVDAWRHLWICRSSKKDSHDDPQTGELSGMEFGSSKGAVRFKYYDKLLKAFKDNALLFWLSVWNIPYAVYAEQNDLAVTRFEWSFYPYRGKFTGMRYLREFSFDGVKGLLNYATLKWGRLSASTAEQNVTRRATHPLWEQLRRWMIEQWQIHRADVARRDYHLSPEVNEAYLNSATGWVGGLMARLALAQGDDAPIDTYQALALAQRYTKPIKQKADERFEILKRLVTDSDDALEHAGDAQVADKVEGDDDDDQ
jgi:hypothetical protein